MPSLRDSRDRITSVKSTKKITSAMKMVAASKLRKAQQLAEGGQPYADAMAAMISRVARNVKITDTTSKLLTGTGDDQRHMVLVVTADRGLCGGFNANLVKAARRFINALLAADKDLSIVCVGRKGRDFLQRGVKTHIKKSYTKIMSKKRIEYVDASNIIQYVLDRYEAGEFDICTIIYNEFQSVLSQKPTAQQLIPLK